MIRIERRRRRAALLLCGMLLVALGLDAWQNRARRAGHQMWLDDAVCAASAPLQGLLLQGSREAEAVWAAIARGYRLAQENTRLAAEVGELRARLTSLQESYAARERERALRAAYAEVGGRSRSARVIGMGSGGWLTYLVVNRGSNQGTRLRDVAVTTEGVVGQVYAVSRETAHVLPITDPSSGLAVRVQRTRESGILKGRGDWQCELRYLDPAADVRAGDELVSAGLGGVFPKGLRVGRVVSVTRDPDTDGKVALVEPAADLRNAEEVLLLRPARPAP